MLLVHPECASLEVPSLAEQELEQVVFGEDVLARVVVVVDAWPFKVEGAAKRRNNEMKFGVKPLLTRISESGADRTSHIR